MPITKKYATLHELQTVYNFDDVLSMHEVIITLAEQEKAELEKNKK